jgi:hypothetical protein
LEVARTARATSNRNNTPHSQEKNQNHSNTARAGTTRDTNPNQQLSKVGKSYIIENPASTEVGHFFWKVAVGSGFGL